MKIFIYQWFVGDERDENDEMVTRFRVYGLDEHGETVCLHIRGFHPWLFVELQTSLSWTEYRNMVKNKILERYKSVLKPFSIMYKKKLYFHHEEKTFPVLKLSFPNIQTRKNAYYRLQKYDTTLFSKKIRLLCHEEKADPLLQLTCLQDLPTAGWIDFRGNHTPVYQKVTSLDHEYTADYVHVNRVEHETVPSITVLSFDIETYSTNSQRMPDASIEGDCIFQISCVLEHKKKIRKILLTLGRVVLSQTIEVRSFENEKNLLLGFQTLLTEFQPHVLIGYNIFGFDIPYMVRRAQMFNIMDTFDRWGIPHKIHSAFKEIRWSSSAYSFQEFHYLDAEGRVLVDLLPVIKREYKFSNYKLKTVSTFFLGETKDPLTPQDIFDAYRECILQKGHHKKLSACGKYCVQDAHLVLRLFQKLETWIGLVEMAKICNVPIMSLYTQGQQIKVFSQVYKKCMKDGILVQSFSSLPHVEALEEVDGYSGAYVFPPKPGVYDWVLPFDFSSLYPTTIIAYNIDYSTLVLDHTVPDEKCHIIEWEDHIGCVHDAEKTKKERVVCKKYRFRFAKEPVGVLPSLLRTLLEQRSETKKRMKSVKDETFRTILDKRQLAYKVSANSMYGAMGVKRGYLPFMPGAMSTTAMGRMSIQKAAEYVQKKHHGQLIYGDSVVPDTPVYIRRNGLIHILTIEDFFHQYPHEAYPQFRVHEKLCVGKEQALPSDDVEILGSRGWTSVRRIIRHTTVKSTYRIYTSSGLVEVTEDHSLLLANGRLIKPVELHRGMCLMTFPDDVLYEQTSHETVPLQYDDDGVLDLCTYTSPVECAKIFWTLRRDFPQLSFTYPTKNTVRLHLHHRERRPRGLVFMVEKRTCSQRQTVYDIETREGCFHCGIGSLVVKNTDSIYCHFTKNADPSRIWSLAKSIETEFIRLFPPPMKLVFEEKIYKTFLILTKKRYMAYTCNQDGSLDKDLTIRGVLLARRDNCRWIRNIYEKVVRMIMDRQTKNEILQVIVQCVLELFQWSEFRVSDFIVSKLVGKNYKIRPLPEDLKKFKKRLDDLHIESSSPVSSVEDVQRFNRYLTENDPLRHSSEQWFQSYIEKSQPSHVQLALKMKRRGFPVEAGSRIEYIAIEVDDPLKSKLNEKIEDPSYFCIHCDILRLDRLYYVQSLAKPLDQLLEIVFHVSDFTKGIFLLHVGHKKVIMEMEERQRPRLRFEGEEMTKKTVTRKKKTSHKSIYDFV